jgi:hypothetical protein
MAIMEAVLASSLHHPNVVQVYTYMLKPLTSGVWAAAGVGSSSNANSNSRLPAVGAAAGRQQQGVGECDGSSGAVAAAAGGGGVGRHEQVTGWQLQLVMEYCDQVRPGGSHQLPLWPDSELGSSLLPCLVKLTSRGLG